MICHFWLVGEDDFATEINLGIVHFENKKFSNYIASSSNISTGFIDLFYELIDNLGGIEVRVSPFYLVKPELSTNLFVIYFSRLRMIKY